MLFQLKYLVKRLLVMKLSNVPNEFTPLALLLAVFCMISRERVSLGGKLGCCQAEMKQTKWEFTKSRACRFERCPQLRSVKHKFGNRHEPHQSVRTKPWEKQQIKAGSEWWSSGCFLRLFPDLWSGNRDQMCGPKENEDQSACQEVSTREMSQREVCVWLLAHTES